LGHKPESSSASEIHILKLAELDSGL